MNYEIDQISYGNSIEINKIDFYFRKNTKNQNISGGNPLSIVPNDSPAVPNHSAMKFAKLSNFCETRCAPPFRLLAAGDSYLNDITSLVSVA